MVKNVLLVGGASAFGLVLAKKLRAVGAKVFVLDTHLELDDDSLDDVEFVCGRPQNTDLVKRLITDCQISRLFLLPRPDAELNVEAQGREILMGTAALIEQVRRTAQDLPQVVQLVQQPGAEQHEQSRLASYRAACLSTEAFLHSYAVSYRMDVRLVRYPAGAAPQAFDKLAKEVLEISSHTAQEPAAIYDLDAETVQTPCVSAPTASPNVRFLIYGAQGWVGQQFVQVLKDQHSNIPYVLGKRRPGACTHAQLRQELAEVAPSHVLCFIGRTQGPGCGNIDYLEGGADKLRENVRDNLFGPWTLANLCEQAGVHFTYLGTGCLYAYVKEAAAHKEDELPTFKGNNYSVCKGFTDRLLPVFRNTLNARIRLPFNHEKSGRNLLQKITQFKKLLDVQNSISYLPDLLPVLLALVLARHTGTLNLVSPGEISFCRMAELFAEETGQQLDFERVCVQDDPSGTASRAHCRLDTARLRQLAPGVLDVESAVRRAVRHLAAASN